MMNDKLCVNDVIYLKNHVTLIVAVTPTFASL